MLNTIEGANYWISEHDYANEMGDDSLHANAVMEDLVASLIMRPRGTFALGTSDQASWHLH